MKKTILVTGATDGIGLATAKTLAKQGHHLLVHGRSEAKLVDLKAQLTKISSDTIVQTYLTDLSDLQQVRALAKTLLEQRHNIDVLINNAGVFTTSEPKTADGYDVRFMVNAFAPYLLTTLLMPALGADARVINLSSAAQDSVNMDALFGRKTLSDRQAYRQSKLALTMWSALLGLEYQQTGPTIVAVNPKSLLASKMVRDAFGIKGTDVQEGADILVRAALGDEFANAGGRYFDNDIGSFAQPHPDAMDAPKCIQVVEAIESIVVE